MEAKNSKQETAPATAGGESGEELDFEPMEPTLEHIVKSDTLRWIFVGGKGGVGKTTVSSSLSTLIAKEKLAKQAGRVLLISTDPAHNISDAFDQKFSDTPTPVKGVENLDALEINPKVDITSKHMNVTSGSPLDSVLNDKEFTGMFNDVFKSMPGIDEAMGFMEIMRNVKSMDYSTIIFDTAPTGHTLHFLNFPNLLQKGISEIQKKFSGMLSQFTSMLGLGNQDEAASKMEENKKLVDEIVEQFKNPDLTTFIPVLIPEFLSIYETERLLQELAEYGIDSSALVVNQLICPSKEHPCDFCVARSNMQKGYVKQVKELYEQLFSVVLLPLLKKEVRGVAELTEFSKNLMVPYKEVHDIYDKE